ncbi:MAG: hypothetical protein AAB433_12655 [Nitrospirota bacterium]
MTYPNSVNVIARKAGKVTIKVTNPVLFDVVTAEVEVLGTVVNVCEPDVPTYAPSGCEWPRVVAKYPFTPLHAGQTVPFSELIEYRPGTCAEIELMDLYVNDGFSQTGPNWTFGGLRDRSISDRFSFLPNHPFPSAIYSLSEVTIVLAQSIPTPSQVRLSMYARYYSNPVLPALVRDENFACSFGVEASGSGP